MLKPGKEIPTLDTSSLFSSLRGGTTKLSFPKSRKLSGQSPTQVAHLKTRHFDRGTREEISPLYLLVRDNELLLACNLCHDCGEPQTRSRNDGWKALLLLAILSIFTLSSCGNEDKGNTPQPTAADTTATLTVRVTHSTGHSGFLLNKRYSNALGQQYTLTAFNYYLSNVVLSGTNSFTEPNSYHLVRLPGSDSITTFIINGVKPGNYSSVYLGIGVDSAANHSVAARGDLSISNEMAWDWNDGYKFVLAEGKYYKADSTLGLVFHPGNDFAYRSTSLVFVPADTKIEAGKHYTLNLGVNVNTFFGGPNHIDFNKTQVIMGDRTESNQFMDNFVASLSVKSFTHD